MHASVLIIRRSHHVTLDRLFFQQEMNASLQRIRDRPRDCSRHPTAM